MFKETAKQQAIWNYLVENPRDVNLTSRELAQRINESSDVPVGSTLVYVVAHLFKDAYVGDVGDDGDVSRVLEVLLECVSDDDIRFAMEWTGFSDTHPLVGVKMIRAEIFKRHSR